MMLLRLTDTEKPTQIFASIQQFYELTNIKCIYSNSFDDHSPCRILAFSYFFIFETVKLL